MGRYNETNILKCTEVKYHSGLIVNVVMPRDIWKVFREVPHVIFFFLMEFWKKNVLNQNGNYKLGLWHVHYDLGHKLSLE